MMIAEISQVQDQLQEKWLIFWWALSIGLLALTIAKSKGLFNPFTASSLPLIRGKDVLRGFGFFLFMELLLIPALVSLTLKLRGEDVQQVFQLHAQGRGWINLLIIVGGFVGVSLAYFEIPSTQRQFFWRQTNEPWYNHVWIGIAAWFVSFPVVLAFSDGLSLILWHIFHHPLVEQVVVQHLRQIMAHPLLFGLTALFVVTIVPLTEEFLFRGLLQTWLKHKFHNTSIAIILSSLVFALFHYSSHQGITNIELLSSLFLLSCMLGYIYERQRSLWASVGLHSFFNLMSLLMIFK
jgi:membrane protease YdiL (CAAX protease family)